LGESHGSLVEGRCAIIAPEKSALSGAKNQ
jgi:hypothetical protein